MSALEKKILSSKLPPLPNSFSGKVKKGYGRKRDYTPVPWTTYFDTVEDVKVSEDDCFRVYSRGEEGPVVFYLHGGGFSALSWACLTAEVNRLVKCRCAAIDLRGHGESHNKEEFNLSAESQAEDVSSVIKVMYGEHPPPIILVGHSMGGAIAVHIAHKQLISSLIGLAVIDVVEGTALDALSSMQSILRNRPNIFKSLEYAIEWSVRSGHLRNIESAKVSMTGQLKKLDTDEPATVEFQPQDVVGTSDVIAEEEEDATFAPCAAANPTSNPPLVRHPSDSGDERYTWRIDLSKTEKYWKGWFQGLSSMFLSTSVPKMLILAGVDRLDKELTIGQMQGKFQMQVLPHCGHVVHEDVPDKVAEVIAFFMKRYQFAETTDDFHPSFPGC